MPIYISHLSLSLSLYRGHPILGISGIAVDTRIKSLEADLQDIQLQAALEITSGARTDIGEIGEDTTWRPRC